MDTNIDEATMSASEAATRAAYTAFMQEVNKHNLTSEQYGDVFYNLLVSIFGSFCISKKLSVHDYPLVAMQIVEHTSNMIATDDYQVVSFPVNTREKSS